MTIAVVTGGGAGIGAACAERLAADAVVIVVDRDEQAAARTVSSIQAAGGQASALVADVSDSSQVDALMDRVVRDFGSIDIAVNNAGISGAQCGVADLTDAQWQETRGINFDGVFYCMRAELRHMRRQGSGVIVNMASILSVVAWPAAAAYTSAKHGVLGLTRSAALDYAREGIRVNAVGPGFISTDLVRNALDDATYAALADLHPRGQMGSPAEVADLVAFLASDRAANITGGFFPIDGGFTAK